MSTVQANRIGATSAYFNENILPNFLTFNRDVDYGGWVSSLGEGVAYNDPQSALKGGYAGRGLYISSTDNDQDFVVNSGGTQTRFTAAKTGHYIFQFWVKSLPGGITDGILSRVSLSKNGAGGWMDIEVLTSQMDGAIDKAIGFYVEFDLNQSDYLDFSFGVPHNVTGGDHTIGIDMLKLEIDDRNQSLPSMYTEPNVQLPDFRALVDGRYNLRMTGGYPYWQVITNPLGASAALNFPSIASGSVAELTMALTGAIADGTQRVQIGAPNVIWATGVQISGYVSNANEITVRVRNNTGGAIDLPSATFTAIIS